MGRHRSDPRGLARILIAALAVVAALALLVVGGVALVNAVSGDPEQKGPSGAASPSADGDGGKTSPTGNESTAPAAPVPLVISVTGQPTNVFVRVADTGGKVLTNDKLDTGDTLKYEQAPLQVVATNGGSLKVVIYGKVQDPKPNGQRAEWLVKAKS